MAASMPVTTVTKVGSFIRSLVCSSVCGRLPRVALPPIETASGASTDATQITCRALADPARRRRLSLQA